MEATCKFSRSEHFGCCFYFFPLHPTLLALLHMRDFFSHISENARLSEREKRCGLFQESLRTDAVVQVSSGAAVVMACLLDCLVWCLGFFPAASWIWMHLSGRIKQRDLEWWQRKVQVSKPMSPRGPKLILVKLEKWSFLFYLFF